MVHLATRSALPSRPKGPTAPTAYLPSSLPFLPFSQGSDARWEMFALSLASAVGAAVAVVPATRLAQFARAGLAGLIALGYLLVWPGISTLDIGFADSFAVLALPLLAIWLADALMRQVAGRPLELGAAALGIPVISVVLFVAAAGIFWRLWLGDPIAGASLWQGDYPTDDRLPLGTIAVVLIGSVVWARSARRRLEAAAVSHRSPSLAPHGYVLRRLWGTRISL